LNIKRFVDEETDMEWQESYMGNDGDFSFYYDAVKNEYSISSAKKRIPFLSITDSFYNTRFKKDLFV